MGDFGGFSYAVFLATMSILIRIHFHTTGNRCFHLFECRLSLRSVDKREMASSIELHELRV